MKYSIKVSEIIDRPDGSADVQLVIDEDFMVWFCQTYKLDRFDQDVFNKWFIDTLTNKLEKP